MTPGHLVQSSRLEPATAVSLLANPLEKDGRYPVICMDLSYVPDNGVPGFV